MEGNILDEGTLTYIASNVDEINTEISSIQLFLKHQKQLSSANRQQIEECVKLLKQPWELYNPSPKKFLWVINLSSPKSRSSQYYQNFLDVLTKLNETVSLLQQDENSHEIISSFNNIIRIYNNFIDSVIKLETQEKREERLEPRMTLAGQMGFRYLDRKIESQLLPKLSDNNQNSMLRVKEMNWKLNPTCSPAVELAIDSLSLLIGSPSVLSPKFLLKIIYNQKVTPLLTSPFVQIKSLEIYLQNNQPIVNNINSSNFSALFILGLLIDPIDAKPNNFKLSLDVVEGKYSILWHDYGSTFCNYDAKYSPNFVLYLFPQMNSPIDVNLRDRFLSSPPEVVIVEFLKELYLQTLQFKDLRNNYIFSKEEFNNLGLSLVLLSSSSSSLSPSENGLVQTLYQKLCLIHDALNRKSSITHLELFNLINPTLYQKYLPFYKECVEAKSSSTIIRAYQNLIQQEQRDSSSKYPNSLLYSSFEYQKIIGNQPHLPYHFQSPICALEDFLYSLNWEKISCSSQHQLLQSILNISSKSKSSSQPSVTSKVQRLCFQSCVVLNDESLQIMSKRFPNLKSLRIVGCAKVTLKGIKSILQFHPEISFTLGQNQQLSTKEYFIIQKQCSRLEVCWFDSQSPLHERLISLNPLPQYPLHESIIINNEELFFMFLSINVNVHQTNSDGDSALDLILSTLIDFNQIQRMVAGLIFACGEFTILEKHKPTTPSSSYLNHYNIIVEQLKDPRDILKLAIQFRDLWSSEFAEYWKRFISKQSSLAQSNFLIPYVNLFNTKSVEELEQIALFRITEITRKEAIRSSTIKKISPPFSSDRFDYEFALSQSLSLLKLSEKNEESELDQIISKVFSYIHQSRQTLHKISGKQVICFVGNTGAGKSTTINYLYGCEMYWAEGHLEKYLEARNPVAKIGHSYHSETLLPSYFEISNSNIVLCDLPGYLENRGSEVNIANSVNIRDIANTASVKLFFIINFESFQADRGEGVKSSISILIDFFGGSLENLNRCTNGITIGVTKISEKAAWKNIVNLIIRLASESGWNLNQGFDRILRLDPLHEYEGSLDNTQILSLITKLEPIPHDNTFHTALRPSDILLIEKISHRISDRINEYLLQEDTINIVNEFKKLETLQYIKHPSVDEAIATFQKNITQFILSKIERIRAIAQLDFRDERVECLKIMRFLDKFRGIDQCFHNSDALITPHIDAVKLELKNIETQIQEYILRLINIDCDEYQTMLVNSLNEIIPSLDDLNELVALEICDFTSMIDKLSKYPFKLQVAGMINSLLSEIEFETKHRAVKYYFGDLVPLQLTINTFQSDIHRIVVEKINECKVTILEQEIQTAFDNINSKLYDNLFLYIQDISKTKLNSDSVHQLVQFGFSEMDITNWQISLKKLQLISEERSKKYILHMEKFLEQMFDVARMKENEKRAELLVSMIGDVFTSGVSSGNSNDLNAYFQELSILDIISYDRVCKTARTQWIVKLEQEIDINLLKSDDNIGIRLKQLFQRISLVCQISACFQNPQDGMKILQRVTNKIKSIETSRIEAEYEQFSMSVPQLYQGMQMIVEGWIRRSPETAFRLFSEQSHVEDILQLLNNELPGLSSYMHRMAALFDAVQKHHQRYCLFAEDDRLQKFYFSQFQKLEEYFTSLKALSFGLYIESQITVLINNLKIQVNKASAEEVERLLNEFTFDSKNEVISQLQTHRASIRSIITHHSNLKEIHERIEANVNNLLEEYKARGQRIISSNYTKAIEQACLTRNFLSIIDSLPSMLETIRSINKSNFESAIFSINSSVCAWLSSGEIIDSLTAKDYESIIIMLQSLRKLQQIAINYPELYSGKLDLGIVEAPINKNISDVYNQALVEIQSSYPVNLRVGDVNSDASFFALTNLDYFLVIHNTYTKLGVLQYNSQYKSLCDKVKRVWSYNYLYSSDYKTNDLPLLEKLAMCMIKDYAIARKLSLIPFIEEIHNSLLKRRCFDAQLFYDLGSIIEKLGDNNEPSIKFEAENILSCHSEFPNCIKQFSEKATRILHFSDALPELQCSPPLSIASKRLLENAYAEYNRSYTTSFNLIRSNTFSQSQHLEHIYQLVTSLKNNMIKNNSLLSNLPEVPILLAHIAILWSYLSSSRNSYPHLLPTQILVIFRMLSVDETTEMKNHVAEIKTGEGKSVVLGILSCFFALLQFNVTVLCYSSYLSKRDYSRFSKLFTILDINSIISYCTIDEVMAQIIKLKHPDYKEFAKAFLENNHCSAPDIWMKSQHSQMFSSKSILLIDEIDILFSEQYYGFSYSVICQLDNIQEYIEVLLQYIWKNRRVLQNQNNNNNSEVIASLLALPVSKQIISKYPNIGGILEQHLIAMLRCLSEKFPNDGTNRCLVNCVVNNNKLLFCDKVGNLVELNDYSSSFAYLYYHEKGKIKLNNVGKHMFLPITCAKLPYSDITNYFDIKLGVTGTFTCLAEYQKMIFNYHGFSQQSCIPSAFRKNDAVLRNSLQDESTTVISGNNSSSKNKYYSEIQNNIVSKVSSGRSCLVVFEDISKLNEFYQFYSTNSQKNTNNNTVSLLIEYLSDDKKSKVISHATFSSQVTLMTRVFGRGIDFICYDSRVIQAGGVHVIFTFFPEKEEEEIQIKGRTCRQDNPGSVCKILYAEDLCRKQLIPSFTFQANVPDLSEFIQRKSSSDDYLNEKRKSLYPKYLEDMKSTFDVGLHNSHRSMEFITAFQNNNRNLALQKLHEFNL